MKNKYEAAGVSLEAGYESTKRIKKHVEATNILGVMSAIGQFGGMFDLSKYHYQQPVLVSGCDGVGTKIKLCEQFNNYRHIGEDLVAMSVNDILVQGAKPLFFLDYIACHKNEPQVIEEIVASIAQGCKLSECALIGGETAEMSDVYYPGGYDLAGFAIGCQEKNKLVNPKEVQVGDIIVGLPANGLHANGYSLVRKILFKDNNIDVQKFNDELGCSLQEELLKPTKIYYQEVFQVLDKIKIKAMAHITGGGYQENILRATNNLGAKINIKKINILPIFELIAQLGKINQVEMFNYFNMGIGYIFIISQDDRAKILELLPEARVIGEVIKETELQLCN
ncbi:MAG: phosphoribosylformylglycinamidine cyclo-ligase [Mycoplasmatales bacterium]